MTADDSDPAAEYDVVIGLEVHAQLATATRCSAAVPRVSALRRTRIRARRASACPARCRCRTHWRSTSRPWWRSRSTARRAGLGVRPQHYFYPDLPKGYQITQHDCPLATGGALSWRSASGAVHREAGPRASRRDRGKSLHEGFADSAGSAYLDFSRSGVPLVEIVTEPDMTSAAVAAEFAAPASGDARRDWRIVREHGGRRAPVRRERVAAPPRRGRARCAHGDQRT